MKIQQNLLNNGMRKVNIIATLLLTLFLSQYSFGQLSAPDGTISLKNAELSTNSGGGLYWTSDAPNTTSFAIFDSEKVMYGYLYGSFEGENFGLRDRDNNWSYKAVLDSHIEFGINNTEMMRIKANGNVGIGTDNPQHKLEVCGTIRANEVLVEEDWCDFVFEPEYCLTTLEEEADFIKLYGHLSNFESAKAMDGMINVNDVFKRQQIQIEENVLHLIELSAENTALQTQVSDLTDNVDQLNNQVTTLALNYETLSKELAKIKKQLR